MFSLQTQSLPSDADTLREELEKSLRSFLRPATGPMVTVEEKSFPELAAVRVSLDHAQAGDRPPPPRSQPVGPIEPALRVDHFEISGKPVRLRGAAIHLSCTARAVRIGQGRDPQGNVLLLLQEAADGAVEVSIARADLEALLLSGAQAAAAPQGVMVESVQLELEARTERLLDMVVKVRAKKSFLTASVKIKGRLEIDDQLVARLSGLRCDGDGALGNLACSALGPQLQRFDGREFSLLALPLGEVKLRDVAISAGAELRVTGRFGSAA